MRRQKPERAAKNTENLPCVRVTASHGRHHFVLTEEGELVEAHRRGKKTDVVVGDLVRISPPSGGVAAIEEVLPRKSLLYRSDEWRVKELASNIDQVAMVFASRPTFNPWFLWKTLLAAAKAGIPVFAIRNKTDLEEGAAEAAAAASELEALGCPVLSVSAQKEPEATLGRIAPVFAGKKTLLVGQSGMGKSTILNLLVPEAKALTREFSEALDLGKQTTTTTRWYERPDGGAIVDSPGFQEFGLEHLELDDVLRGMPDILEHIDGCRFFNCRHLSEPGCSVKAAVERGEISRKRYEFYEALAAQILSRKTYG